MARIAIIDDAIHSEFLSQPVKTRYCLSNGVFKKQTPILKPELTHGTMVAKVLEHYGIGYEIISIQLVDSWLVHKRCPVDFLKQALSLCLNLNCNLINVSLGTTCLSDESELAPIMEKVMSLNLPIVAACSNTFRRTILASLSGVFGVVCDLQDQLKAGTYAYLPNPYLGTEFIANYDTSIVGKAGVCKSNSLAASVISAQINNLINEEGGFSAHLVSKLKQNAMDLPKVEYVSHVHFPPYISIPVVYLVDIFADQPDKQIELLNLFKEDGYEAVGATTVNEPMDVRFIKLSDINNNSAAEIQNSICSCADIDLAIIFVPLSFMQQLEWTGFDRESALVIYGKTKNGIPSKYIKLQTSICDGNNVHMLFQKLRKHL